MKHYIKLFMMLTLFPVLLTACVGPAGPGNDSQNDSSQTSPSSSDPGTDVDTSQLFRYDGYMRYQTEAPTLTEPTETLSLFYSIAPASWETVYTGIVSELSPADNAGYDLSMGKYRSIAFRFGNGKRIITVETSPNVLKKDEWNTVQVDFQGGEGTVTITVNGAVARTERIASTKIVPAKNVKKRIGCNYDNDKIDNGVMIRNVFDGYITEQEMQGKVTFSLKRDLTEEVNHPALHAAPIEGWMNEPHGPFYYNGKYHLFFQSNPHGPYFANLCWGHWVSDDMVNWTNLPTVMDPEYGTVSPDGCWSGSSIIAPDGKPLIFYTAGNDQMSPNQMIALARPDDISDPNLTNWTRDDDVIITQEKSVMRGGDFRDPFVFEENGKYWCLVGAGNNATGAGNAGVYLAKDDSLTEWEYKGFLMDYYYEPEIGHVWELPVVLPVKGGSKDVTHILTVVSCQMDSGHPVKLYYWLGRFDAETGKFIPKDLTLRSIDENALIIGSTGFVTPDDRSVLFLTVQAMRNNNENGIAGYANCMTYPLEVWVENDELRIKPIDEVKSLRKDTLLSLQNVDEEKANQALANIKEGEYELLVELSNEDFTFLISGKKLSYNKGTSEFGFLNDSYGGKMDVVKASGDTITLRILIDRSVVDCFFDEQSYCATRVYTTNKLARSVSITTSGVVKSLTVYKSGR